MNHDATHCADYKQGKCPKSCYRAKLTEELKHICHPLPTSWASFKGTKECPKTEGVQGNRMPKDERKCKIMIGENIKQLMQENGYTQKQLAMRSGCTETAISRYVNGNRNPSVKVLKNLAISLGVTVDELIKGGD